MKKINKSESEWKELLSTRAYNITRKKGTEAPFSGYLYLNKDNGSYHCICCDNILFSLMKNLIPEQAGQASMMWPLICLFIPKRINH